MAEPLIVVGQRWRCGPVRDFNEYEVVSTTGPDPQYPIVLKRTRLSQLALQGLGTFHRQNRTLGQLPTLEQYIADYMASTMEVEPAWFRRHDVMVNTVRITALPA